MNTEIISDKNNLFDLNNTNNYYSSIEIDTNVILEKYTSLIIDYIKLIFENKIKTKDTSYFRFIIIRGLNTMTHVFQTIFYFTKNIELSYYYTQKSFYLYIEFVTQINNDENTFLQLNTKDAIMYVYKKTVFEIDTTFLKNIKSVTNDDFCKLDIVKQYIILYENIFIKVLNNCELKMHNLDKYEKKNPFINGEFEKVLIKINEHTFSKEELTHLHLCENKMTVIKNITNYLESICWIISQPIKKTYKIDLTNKSFTGDFENKETLMNWLYNSD